MDVEASEQQISAAETERMMKIQEVVLKAMAGKLKWWEAAEIIIPVMIENRRQTGARGQTQSFRWSVRSSPRRAGYG